MGRARLRKYTKRRNTESYLPKQQWRDLVVATALLLGAEFGRSGRDWTCEGVYAGECWKCARDWLWRRKTMAVRKDGSIYDGSSPRAPEGEVGYASPIGSR